jgi:hypothetical protein
MLSVIAKDASTDVMNERSHLHAGKVPRIAIST